MTQTITTIQRQEIRMKSFRPIRDYDFYPTKWKWFTKWLIKLLQLLKPDVGYIRVDIKHVELRTDSLLHDLRMSSRELEMIWSQRSEVLLVGIDVMDQIYMMSVDHPLSFSATQLVGLNGEIRVLNYRVIVCPWIRGWCLLPKEVTA